ncbi:hypothetical protein DCS_02444 [Drechmeria coniospora]|uniref:Glycosyl transferase family 25 domain-containing protein n=1 Tax=Drechmeria coniospora TaxID=98403 RepID=A0A151GW95_DRECN|nr:hypothetical protein DCS_02444 [Drechmeria coniospora]KYK61302.1 hypothetical protein DCS_02444 [Drechmeria coniospora]
MLDKTTSFLDRRPCDVKPLTGPSWQRMVPLRLLRIAMIVTAAIFLFGVYHFKDELHQRVQRESVLPPVVPLVVAAAPPAAEAAPPAAEAAPPVAEAAPAAQAAVPAADPPPAAKEEPQEPPKPQLSNQELSMLAAGNSTLGFRSIEWINLKHRFDRLDALSLQAYLTGLDVTIVPAVEPGEIFDSGMPPTHRPVVKTEEKGCWRAHANIWAKMLRENTPATLILEADATWDINIKEIMMNFNKHFTPFIIEQRLTPQTEAGWYAMREAEKKGPDHVEQVDYDPNDPWHSRYWDVLSIGQCFEGDAFKWASKKFPDPHVPAGKDFFGETLGEERVVRQSGGMICTTAYAVSRAGAAKLLVRGAMDLDNPVDQLISQMIAGGGLKVYSVMPSIMAQWKYANNIGMDARHANSDVNKKESSDPRIDWTEVRKTGTVWVDRENHPNVAFKQNALRVAWERIVGDRSLTDSSTADPKKEEEEKKE